MTDTKIEVRRFNESTCEKLVIYQVNGKNYSELLIKTMLEEVLKEVS